MKRFEELFCRGKDHILIFDRVDLCFNLPLRKALGNGEHVDNLDNFCNVYNVLLVLSILCDVRQSIKNVTD